MYVCMCVCIYRECAHSIELFSSSEEEQEEKSYQNIAERQQLVGIF